MGSYLTLPVFVPSNKEDLIANGIFVGHNSQYNFDLYVSANKTAYMLAYNDGGPIRTVPFSLLPNTTAYLTYHTATVTTVPLFTQYGDTYSYFTTSVINTNMQLVPFNSMSEAVSFLTSFRVEYPITYRLTNCSAPDAPTEAAIGDTVTVPFQFTSGYGIVNPSSDVYVTNNGVVVSSQYSNGVLTFIMPDPS